MGLLNLIELNHRSIRLWGTSLEAGLGLIIGGGLSGGDKADREKIAAKVEKAGGEKRGGRKVGDNGGQEKVVKETIYGPLWVVNGDHELWIAK